jgi:2-polyprenyl-6-methoxyphenol hydroxylase-like FAD-dependent oxidoreductase
MEVEYTTETNARSVPQLGERAIVIGAGMAGLITARVLADGFEEVLIIDRDTLPDSPAARSGVPQNRHLHAIHGSAQTILDQLFPSYSSMLESAGAVSIDVMKEFDIYLAGDYLAPGHSSGLIYCASRPLFEYVLRTRVENHSAIECWAGCHFLDYSFDNDGNCLNGIIIREEGQSEQELLGDLVVDATGRMSRTAELLQKHDFPAPQVTKTEIDLSYSSTIVDRPSSSCHAVWAPAEPPRTRGGGVLPIEDDQWQVMLHGIHGDAPPLKPDPYKQYAESLPISAVSTILDDRPLDEDSIYHYPFPTNRRIHYERLDEFPERLVVVGDAIASFNPIYGHGISIAALESLMLHEILREGKLRKIGPRFFDQIQPLLDVAWLIAAGNNENHSMITSPKALWSEAMMWYLIRVMKGAHTDGDLREILVRVLTLETPPMELMKPHTIWRTIEANLRNKF